MSTAQHNTSSEGLTDYWQARIDRLSTQLELLDSEQERVALEDVIIRFQAKIEQLMESASSS